jgi:aspergillopepsin I
MLYVPPEIAALYWADVVGATLNSSGYYFYRCGTKLPSFTFGVGDSSYVIPGSYMGFPSHGWPICIGGIQSNVMTGGLNIFGIVLLKAVFVVFDAAGPRLGFASKLL